MGDLSLWSSRLLCGLFLDLGLLGGHFKLLAFLGLLAFSTAGFLAMSYLQIFWEHLHSRLLTTPWDRQSSSPGVP